MRHQRSLAVFVKGLATCQLQAVFLDHILKDKTFGILQHFRVPQAYQS